jgi:hypothetical protein
MALSRDVNLLQKKLKDPFRAVIADVTKAGFEVVPFSTLRTPADQARLWRSSRSKGVIGNMVRRLRGFNANYVANVLENVGPQFPEPGQKGHKTNAIPGESWHNYGLAVDCYGKDKGGDMTWDPDHEVYQVYHEAALANGLHLGPDWDAVHIQFSEGHNPRKVYGSYVAMDEALRAYHGVV